MRTIVALLFVIVAPLAWSDDDPEFTRAREAYDKAAAAEKAAIRDFQTVLEDFAKAEQGLVDKAERELANAKRDVARLVSIEDRLSERFADRLTVSLSVVRLRTEDEVLSRWFNEMTTGKATIPVALRVASLELGALARANAIDGPAPSFSTPYELRNRLANVKRKLGRAAGREAKERVRLQGEIDALKQQWNKALVAIGTVDPPGSDALKPLLGAAKLVADKRMALMVCRRELLAAHANLMRVAHDYTPPILQQVSISSAGGTYYSANWVTDGETEDVRQVDQLLKATRAKLDKVSRSILDMEAKRRKSNAVRLARATQMHGLAKVIYQDAQSYFFAVQAQVVAGVVVDTCSAVVSFCATGGAATLAQAGNRVVQELEEKAVDPRALSYALPAGASGRLARLLQDHVKMLAQQPLKVIGDEAFRAQFIREAANAAEIAVRTEGGDIGAATQAARREAAQALDAMRATLQARDGGFAKLVEQATKDAIDAQPKAALNSVGRFGSAAVIGRIPGDGWLKPTNVDAEIAKVVLGDTLSTGITTVGGMYLKQRLATPDLTRWQAFKNGLNYKNFKETMRGQAVGLLISAVGTGVKVYFTKQLGDQANDAITDFWKRYGELAALQKAYALEVDKDRAIYEELSRARLLQATLERDLVTLQKPRTLSRTTSGYFWNQDHEITVRLAFSNYVTRPPVVSLGSAAMTVTPEGDPKTARVWFAKMPASKLGSGTARLEVALAPGTTPWDSLDADPSRRAYLYIPVLRQWRDWKKGADENHVLEVDFEISDAIRALRAYDKRLTEQARRASDLYGAGPGNVGGWNGMDATVRAVEKRIGAPVKGDPDGIWWLAGNKLELSNAGARVFAEPVSHFRQHLQKLAYRGKRMGAAERAYQKQALEALSRWSSTRDQWDKAANTWIERRATFGKIGGIPDEAKRKEMTARNQQAVAETEELLRSLTPKIPKFKPPS